MMMSVWCSCIFLIAVTLPLVSSEKCGYVRGPLASTTDTVVINLNCSQSTALSHYVPLQLRDNATHVAVQLLHCHTVPVGLFTNVTDNLTSVTFASEDAVQLLEGTFEGLDQITELRLLGFSLLKNLSKSMLEPLRNIQTLILDGFGGADIELPYLGSIIQKLSGTPIRRLVINKIKDQLFFQQTIQVDNFTISNASLKELIITDVPFNFKGSIPRAFPDLTCFCVGGNVDEQTPDTFPAMMDLIFTSKHLKELVLYVPKNLPKLQAGDDIFKIPIAQLGPLIRRTSRLYPDLVTHFSNFLTSEDCALGIVFKICANLSKVTFNDILFSFKTHKPLCVEEGNNLVYLDGTGSRTPGFVPVFIGLQKLRYFNLENTGIRTLPNTFLQYYPSLEVIKLSKLDIGDFVETTDGNLFGSCPTLTDIHLDDCNITNIPTTMFSRSVNLQHLDLSKNALRTFDFDLQNCTMLLSLNLRRNNIETINQKRTSHLTQLALRKTAGNNLVVDLTENRLHCLCNTTNFIKWLQRSPTDSNIEFRGFDTYTCLYPNGSIVRVSEVIFSELQQQCNVIQTLVNGSDCPCDEDLRKRLEQAWVNLHGFFCRNGDGDLVPMQNQPFPSCFNPYSRASFIAPVVIGGILGIAVFVTVGLLIYHRNSKRVKQVRECLEMNPVNFVRTALQYVMMHNRPEEQASFHYDMIVFVQDDDQSSIHTQFIAALHGTRNFITRDNFLPGVPLVDAMAECIRVCQWIVPVLTEKFLSDPVCMDFLSRAQFSRPHALIPIVWEELLAVTDISVEDLLRTGEPLYWPGDPAAPEHKRNFWSSFVERARPIDL